MMHLDPDDVEIDALRYQISALRGRIAALEQRGAGQGPEVLAAMLRAQGWTCTPPEAPDQDKGDEEG